MNIHSGPLTSPAATQGYGGQPSPRTRSGDRGVGVRVRVTLRYRNLRAERYTNLKSRKGPLTVTQTKADPTQ